VDFMIERSETLLVAILVLGGSLPAWAASQPGAASAPVSTLEELDRRLADSFARGRVPGASVAVVEGGQVIFSKGYGLADVAAQRPATPETPFRAGSIAKSLTGIAVMHAVEQGRLSLDAKVADLAPEIRFVNPWQASDPLRLVHLLEHTTGWPDISIDVLVKDGVGWTLRQGVEYASPRYVSRWKPGLFSTYNNAGPSVAGYLLEKATGQEFATYTRENVVRPMGMAQADFDVTPELRRSLALSYAPSGSATPYQTIILPPSGSLAASARELAQLVLFFLGRGTVNGNRILGSASVDRIERQESSVAFRAGLTNGYGLGNAPFPGGGHEFRGHNGGIDSYTSVYGYSVAKNGGFVVLANGGEGTDFSAPAAELIKGYLMRAGPPQAPPAVTVGPEELASHAGFYATVSPAYEFLRVYGETVLLPLQRVRVRDGKLYLRGELIPIGGKLFRRENRSEPSMAFSDLGGEHLMLTGLNTLHRETAAQAAPKLAVLAVLVVSLVLAVVMLPFHLIGLLRGRLAARGGVLVRLLPLAALASLMATFAVPLAAFASQAPDSLHGLARPSLLSITVLVCSLAFPVLAAVGLWRAVRAKDLGRFVRGYAVVACTAVLIAAAYAARFGWLGVRTWTW
jgi:CubicO group peptidase (beta-lactamase class C family)